MHLKAFLLHNFKEICKLLNSIMLKINIKIEKMLS
jgi:hypothetical protein